MKSALTALQPTNTFHLGNYFGAIEPAIALQDEYALTMFIVDYHAITVPQKPEDLRKNILFAAATYLACGLDPARATFFQQSAVPAHTELAWILSCQTRMGEAERMTQYKDKAKGKGESVSVGLFNYPILMAADILLYGTEVVPVGDDQKQHVELARDLAIRFNRDYGETFTVPEPAIRKEGARLMGLDDPAKKMSKSAPSPKNYLALLDDADTIRKKIRSAVTDSGSEVKGGADRPALQNLLTLFSLVTHRPVEAIETEYIGKGYGDFKADLAEAVILFLLPLQAKIHAHLENEDALKRLLEEGAEKARERAERTMKRVREHIGLTL